MPASSFYEWEKAGKPPKTPYSFKLANGHPIGFADLWDAWKDKQGHWLQSFAIVTTEANELMSRVHPRNAVHPLPISLKLRPACGLPGDYVIGIDTQTLMRMLEKTDLPSAVLSRFKGEETLTEIGYFIE